MVMVSEAFAIALSFHEAGRFGEAKLVYQQILAVDPTNPSSLANLALIDQREDEINRFKKALSRDPMTLEGLLKWAPVLRDCGRVDEAIECYEQAFRLKPDQPDVIRHLSILLYRKGLIDQAVNYLEQAIAVMPDLAEAHQSLIRMLETYHRFAEMEAACMRILTSGPAPVYMEALAMIGPYLERQNRHGDALHLYEHTINLAPGHAYADTRRRLLLIRRSWGQPPAPLTRPPGPYITMSSLGKDGRFGNQIIQYAFVRLYAHVHGLGWEVPDWIGRDLFGLDDPYITEQLPALRRDQADFSSVEHLSPELAANRDIAYLYDFEDLSHPKYREFYQSLFSFSESARRTVQPVLSQLRAWGHTVVAIHLRRGDLRGSTLWIVPEQLYLEWLTELWPTLDRPVLFVASDEPEVVSAFAAFSPVTGADFPKPPPGVEFLIDYAVLIDADIVATSNSSFSYTAVLMNRRGRLFMRASRAQNKLVPYDPWVRNPERD